MSFTLTNVDFLFENSFEVANKVGGIYAVVKSKAAQMAKIYADNYYTIGFFDPKKASVELDQKPAPKQLNKAFESLEKQGIKCFFGRWLIPGTPKTILIDAENTKHRVNEIKTWLWEQYQVDSIRSDNWFNDPVVWSYATGLLIEQLIKTKPFKDKKIAAHFHEWLSGAGLLYLKNKKTPVGCVFTTHATMLGRTIAGSGEDLYGQVNKGLAEGRHADISLAKRYGVEDKYSMERACAHNADVFSTVSNITGKEAHYLLGREPDILLPNGLDTKKYAGLEDLAIARRKIRSEMKKFLAAYFKRYYEFDLDKIRSVFLSGRYEYHNKGIDVFIDALGRLNNKLKENKSENTVVAFIFVPSGTRGENIEVLKNVSLYSEVQEHVEGVLPELADNIINLLAAGRLPDKSSELFNEKFLSESRKLIAHFTEKAGQTPPLCALQLSYDESKDPIINECLRVGLLNRREDKVKVIFYPAYLSAADRMIGLEYNEATLTCDMGVFPSFYEPWGYTPVEAAVQATPSVTSDLAGFGQFIKGKGEGIKVLDMEGIEYDQIVDQLYQHLLELSNMEKEQLTALRINAKKLSKSVDWDVLAENYVKAHKMAVSKVSGIY
ncbi:MAG: hypothetical protein GF334_07325 [Candidatus Altiarchaeales archaeon]|nr:hypothetical protein [Candidatus Altiarchaeales archaeon]